MLTAGSVLAAARLRELLTNDELALLDAVAGGGQFENVTPGLREVNLMALLRYQLLIQRQGQLLPQPDLNQVDWDGLRARATSGAPAAWDARLRETAELQCQLLAVFEACTQLTQPAPLTRRDSFLISHLWWRPLHTLFCAAGSNLARYEAVVRGAVARERSLGTAIASPQDIRETGLELAAEATQRVQPREPAVAGKPAIGQSSVPAIAARINRPAQRATQSLGFAAAS